MAQAKLILSDPTRDEMLTALAQSSADEFDIEAAIYWFASDWHGGQSSNLYSALSTSPYRPGWSENCCPDEAMDCYDTLMERFVNALQAVLRVTNIRTSEQKRSPHQSRTSS